MRMLVDKSSRITFVTVLTGIIHSLVSITSATVSCTTDVDCEQVLRPGSRCIEGSCDNPFGRGGCLKQLKPGWHSVRVCGSDDSPEALSQGECRLPQTGLEYTEIRIHAQNWESAFFQAWILQIILSEVLHVPVSIETGMPDLGMDFYDHKMPFDYGVGYDLDALRTAQQVGDCHAATKRKSHDWRNSHEASEDVDSDSYVSCCHVIPEVWDGIMASVSRMEREGIIEPPHGMGTVGHGGWFIPKFTGERDPTLLNYLGLRGEANRRKLAETFMRPTSWKQFCDEVSPTKCTIPDSTAVRAPIDDVEGSHFFVDGLYTGHFRKTHQNDCDSYPNNCTGHFVDFTCGWDSYVLPQLTHLNIALESNGPEPVFGGYTYEQMIEIWAAANATKSDVMMLWWTPEAHFQQYLGTGAEFQRVTLPPPTQACADARVDIITRCEGTWEERIGDPAGACDHFPIPLRRLVTQNLYSLTRDETLPSGAQHSPAYDAIKALQLSGLQVGAIFDLWLQRAKDKWSYDPREVVCRWVVDNFDQIQNSMPKTFPRVIEERNENSMGNPLFVASVTMSFLSIVFVLFCIECTYRYRTKRCMVYAQPEFLAILLMGLLLVSTGALILALPPTNVTCVVTVWSTNIGYTVELVPLVVKIAAINQIMQAAMKLRRVKIDRRSLFGAVIALSMITVVFLIVWTVVDSPVRRKDYRLTNESTEFGETIVSATPFCQSSSDAWGYISILWHALLLLCATVLAFQTRKIRHEVNEAQTLAFMIYSQFLFVILRLIVFSLSGEMDAHRTPQYLSLVFSGDVIATCCIYFVPKFMRNDHDDSLESMSVNGVMLNGSHHRREGLPQERHNSQGRPTSSGQPDRTTEQSAKATQENELHSSSDLMEEHDVPCVIIGDPLCVKDNDDRFDHQI